MQTIVTTSRKIASPLSYEYGFLCFRLLAVTVTVCLLDRWDELDTILNANQDWDLAVHVLLSELIAPSVIDQLNALNDGADCDWCLGWSTPPHNCRQLPLLPRPDALVLYHLIWNDRKMFLYVLASCPLPELSGLLFLFFRYFSDERNFRESSDREAMREILFELCLRYSLATTEQERQVTMPIIDAIGLDLIGYWASKPRHIDIPDSRLILNQYIKILSSGDEHLFKSREPFDMLHLVIVSGDTYSQDLFGEVVRLTLEYTWAVLLRSEEVSVPVFLQRIFTCLFLLIVPRYDNPYRLESPTQKQIIETMRQYDILDLAARLIIHHKPSQEQSSGGDPILGSVTRLFLKLSETVPQPDLARCFEGYVPEWWKVNEHLYALAYQILTPNSPAYRDHYVRCMKTWSRVAYRLGLEQAIDDFAYEPCSNGRCPDAHIPGGRFVCAGCAITLYCDSRCQAMHWRFGDHALPHRKMCYKPTRVWIQP
ncbi:unnamed protein product [Rhizoctonia solani]|uniref:MYND-type domain-containing protein n=1 Tax=Rhizoctonia solani TaxID=456999 RepID=A0A8H3BBJ0_9AGAM|nr:unnamed protein product [Rhizoctonia solani]